MKTHVKKDLDKDWHMLIQEARSIGLGIRDVRQFLESEPALRKNNQKNRPPRLIQTGGSITSGFSIF